MNVNEQIDHIVKYLSAKYGEVRPQWWGLIEQLRDNLDMIEACKNELKTSGLFNPKTGKKNPLISSIKDFEAQNTRLYKELTCTPWTESKTKESNAQTDDELLKRIMGE